MTEADLAIYHELRGTVCACGATKKARQSFCRRDFFSLPKGTQRELYEVDGYPETYRRACGLLWLPPTPGFGATSPISPTCRAEAPREGGLSNSTSETQSA
jgi:hypothetical protein